MKPFLLHQLERYADRLAELRSADPEHREQTMQTVQRLFLRKER